MGCTSPTRLEAETGASRTLIAGWNTEHCTGAAVRRSHLMVARMTACALSGALGPRCVGDLERGVSDAGPQPDRFLARRDIDDGGVALGHAARPASGSEQRRRQPTATRSRARRADKDRNLPRQQPRIRRRGRGTSRDSGGLEVGWQFEDEAPHRPHAALVVGSQGRRNAESHHRRKGAVILKTGQISAERLRRRAN